MRPERGENRLISRADNPINRSAPAEWTAGRDGRRALGLFLAEAFGIDPATRPLEERRRSVARAVHRGSLWSGRLVYFGPGINCLENVKKMSICLYFLRQSKNRRHANLPRVIPKKKRYAKQPKLMGPTKKKLRCHLCMFSVWTRNVYSSVREDSWRVNN